jgi:hypothetical protein
MAPMDGRAPYTYRSAAAFAMAGLTLIVSFIVLLIIIVNTPEAADTAAQSTFEQFRTRPSLLVYETLLAGMLGAYISEIFGLGAGEAPDSGQYLRALLGALFLGACAAIVVGVLFPLVILGRFEGKEINSWTLVAAAGIAGNRARSALAEIELRVQRLLEGLAPRIDQAALSQSVKAGLQEVLSQKLPVKYDGYVAVDITANNESVLQRGDQEERLVRLERGRNYSIQVQFAPDRNSWTAFDKAMVKAINIREGEEAATAPFRVLVDFGFVGIAPAERLIEAPRHGASTVEVFAFTVPRAESQISYETLPSDIPQPPPLQPGVSVSIYQNTRFFEACVMPIVLQA